MFVNNLKLFYEEYLLLLKFYKIFFTFRKAEKVNLRKSSPEAFCKKDVLKNFAKFTGKLLRSLIVNKVAGLRPYRTPPLTAPYN